VLLPQARGIGLADIGILVAVHGAVATVLEVPSGAVADAVGRRRTLLAGAGLICGSLTAFAFAQSMAVFAVAEALLAAGRAAISGSLEAWFVDARRSLDADAPLRRPLSRASAAGAFGLAVGSLIGGAVPHIHLGLAARGHDTLLVYSPAVLLGAALALVYLVAVAALVRGPGSGPSGASAERGLQAIRDVARAGRASLRASRTVRLLLAAAMGLGVCVATVETLWQPRLVQLVGGPADDTSIFGLLSAGAMLAVAGGASLAPALSARVGGHAHMLYALAALVGTATLAALALAGDPLPFAFAFIAFYGLIGIIDPLHLELVNENVPGEARATMLSVSSLAEQVGGVTSSLTLPRLAAGAGVPAAWWVVTGVLGAVALVARALPQPQASEREDRDARVVDAG
jgi:MFS family permease